MTQVGALKLQRQMQKQAAAIGESSKLTENEENKVNGVNGSNLQNGTKKDK